MATADLLQDSLNGSTPSRIGRFVLDSELGRGRMGAVYKATDSENGQTVAIRLVQLFRFSTEPDAARIRLRDSARAASGLDCPNIVSLFGGGELGEMFYLTLEYVPGTTLRQRLLKKERFSVSEFLDVARQLCAGLDHAHARKIFHGNLVPWNLIFEHDGTLKIMDFGLARNLVASDSRDDSDYVPYLSPEQLRGQPIDARSDLFSAASILYEMLAGRKAFEGSSREQIAQNVLDGFAPPAHESSITIHPGLSAVLAKALAKDPGDRYQRGADLIRELENYKSFGAAKPPAVEKPAPILEKPAPVPAKPAPAVVSKPTPPPVTIPAPVAKAPAVTRKPERKPVAAKPVPVPAPVPNRSLMVVACAAAALLSIIGTGLWLTRVRQSKPNDQPRVLVAEDFPLPSAAVAPAEPSSAAPGITAPKAAKPRAKVAAPAVPAAPVTGDLIVSSTPAGAMVQIDGGAGEPAPFTQSSIPAGPHTVTFSKAGYVSVSRTVSVVAGGKALVAVTLQPQGALVAVTSTPAGAAILVDGRETGQVTPASLTVGEGAHTITVRKDGYLAQSASPTLALGQEFRFSPELATAGTTSDIRTVGKFKRMLGAGGQEMGMVEVKSSPKGAEVTVNGHAVPKATPVAFMLSPGNYEVLVQMAGYRPAKRVISVNKGGQVKVEEQLAKN